MQSLKLTNLLLSVALLTTLSACSDVPELDNEILAQAQILNLRAPEETVMSSGQPTEDQFRILADAGVKHVINLRPLEEQEWDEESFVESLNMQYYSIPVAGGEDVTRENAEQLYQLLESLEGEPVIVHCASGNRVGALVALSAAQHQGLDVDQAMVEGERWGLTSPRLTPVVRQVLSATN